MRHNIIIYIFFAFLIILFISFIYNISSVFVIDAYSDNNGNLNFTIINNRFDRLNITYIWSLNDPKSDIVKSFEYKGSGNISIPGFNREKIVIKIPCDSYDTRFLIMNIEVYDENKLLYRYKIQKNPYVWDYSDSPPKYIIRFLDIVNIGVGVPFL